MIALVVVECYFPLMVPDTEGQKVSKFLENRDDLRICVRTRSGTCPDM